MYEKKKFLKLANGQTMILKVESIKKVEGVQITGEEGVFTLYAADPKEQLRLLYNADDGKLVGKRLRFYKPERGPVTVSLAASGDVASSPDTEPF